MAENPLLAQLLQERATGVSVRRTAVIEPPPVPTQPPVNRDMMSPTAFEVDKWGMRQGERLATTRRDVCLMADCHYALFEPDPQLADDCASPIRREWFENLMQTDEYVALHATTTFDMGMSEIAALKLAEAYKEYIDSIPDGEDCTAPRNAKQDIDLIRSIQGAIDQASQDSKDAMGCAQGLGMTTDPNGKVDSQQLAEAFKMVRNDYMLRQIFEAAGRFRCFARAAQRAKVKHGYDDMIGIRMAGDVPSLVSGELAKLADAELELDLLRRLVERQAICREYQGEQPQGLGPIVVYCDESSSMGGQNIIRAKALCLTMGWVAQQQNRWIAFVSFNSRADGARLCMPPGRWNQEKLIGWITGFSGGGTALTNLLQTLPQKYWAEFNAPKGKTDIIVITDGAVDADRGQAARFNQWKREVNAKCFGLIVDSSPGGLADVCDRYWMLGDLSMQEQGIQEVLSI